MNADEVNAVFAWAQRRHGGTPCRECSGRNTSAYLYELVVMVSCEDCGGATPKGRLKHRAPTA